MSACGRGAHGRGGAAAGRGQHPCSGAFCLRGSELSAQPGILHLQSPQLLGSTPPLHGVLVPLRDAKLNSLQKAGRRENTTAGVLPGRTSSLWTSAGDLLWLVGESMQVRSMRSALMEAARGPFWPELPTGDSGLLAP
jgi:hypothetical protein